MAVDGGRAGLGHRGIRRASGCSEHRRAHHAVLPEQQRLARDARAAAPALGVGSPAAGAQRDARRGRAERRAAELRAVGVVDGHAAEHAQREAEGKQHTQRLRARPATQRGELLRRGPREHGDELPPLLGIERVGDVREVGARQALRGPAAVREFQHQLHQRPRLGIGGHDAGEEAAQAADQHAAHRHRQRGRHGDRDHVGQARGAEHHIEQQQQQRAEGAVPEGATPEDEREHERAHRQAGQVGQRARDVEGGGRDARRGLSPEALRVEGEGAHGRQRDEEGEERERQHVDGRQLLVAVRQLRALQHADEGAHHHQRRPLGERTRARRESALLHGVRGDQRAQLLEEGRRLARLQSARRRLHRSDGREVC
mmetsp:Transcript_27307/g.67360  ORF Transcript_27307/g.67360 Transcript_27307/m.67360 type:complete len:371 (+) Transcript_27307:218-1330(+)